MCSGVSAEVGANRQYKAQVRFPTMPVQEAMTVQM